MLHRNKDEPMSDYGSLTNDFGILYINFFEKVEKKLNVELWLKISYKHEIKKFNSVLFSSIYVELSYCQLESLMIHGGWCVPLLIIWQCGKPPEHSQNVPRQHTEIF